MKRLAIITTHPIQYYVPVFQLISEDKEIDLKVFYTWGEHSLRKHDIGFKKIIEWDIPLLDGYKYQFLKNTARDPGSHHFYGIINPDIINDIKSFNPDVVLVYGWSYHSHFKVIRYFKGNIPVWFRGDSTLLDAKSKWKTSFRAIFLRWIYSHIDKAFYTGSANKAYFLKHGVKESQLYFAPHAIDNERFGVSRKKEAEALRRALNIGTEDILILFAGKFEKKKDPLALIDAFIQLSRVGTKLLIVGDGELYPEVKSMAGENRKIHIHPFVNQKDIPVYYQACDLFCLPSKGPGETWGLAVNEAMAAGKAVLVSEKAGCAFDLVKKYQNGLIFNPERNNSLKEALKNLLSDKDQLILMGKKSGEIIKKYGFSHQVTEIKKNLLNQK